MLRSTLARWVGALLFALPLAALAQDAYTARTASVRAGPDRSYPLVMQVPPGVPMQVFGCLEGYAWCDVQYGDVRGWVWSGNLSYPYQSNRVPLLQYGAAIGLPIITFSIGSYWDRYYRGRPWYANRSYWVNRAPPRSRGPEPRPYNAGRPEYRPRVEARGERRDASAPRADYRRGENRAPPAQLDPSRPGRPMGEHNRGGPQGGPPARSEPRQMHGPQGGPPARSER